MRAMYLSAPRGADLDATIDHHLGIRNFFAWLYNVPMAGRTLGRSLVDLKDHLDLYRPGQEERNQADIVTFADFQRYLDFRECVDHALAAMHFAEYCQVEDLWIDAFAHCVGMGHRGLRSSLEYPILSRTSKNMISKARLEVDVRSDRVSRSVANFFENDLSAAFLGLHQAAREHLDRFRSFLQSFYIEQHGFWPPQDFEEEEIKKALYMELYSDFRNLYHHLVDNVSTSAMVDNVSHSGGVCTLQNIQAFDSRHSYEALPHPLPRLPTPPTLATSSSTSKLANLSMGKKRRAQREARDEQAMQALIDSSNRDWNIMSCLLVRRYSEFERLSVLDDFENVSLVDGRKVRWILIYAVLQTLITIMQAPKQVRNTEGLSYSLCCHIPKTMPWIMGSSSSFDTQSLASSRTSEATASIGPSTKETKVELTPDVNYSHTNSSSASISQIPSRSRAERRSILPVSSTTSTVSTRTTTPVPRKSSTASRSSSLRRFLVKRSTSTEENPLPNMPSVPRRMSAANKAPAFCEIFVQGYGNGLNNAIVAKSSTSPSSSDTMTPKTTGPTSPVSDDTENVTVSRESSSASASSAYTARSGSSNPSDSHPDMDHLSVCDEDTNNTKAAPSAARSTRAEKNTRRQSVAGSVRRARMSVIGAEDLYYKKAIDTEAADTVTKSKWTPGMVFDEKDQLKEVQINTETWDAFLDLD
jgi:hypothetical protein